MLRLENNETDYWGHSYARPSERSFRHSFISQKPGTFGTRNLDIILSILTSIMYRRPLVSRYPRSLEWSISSRGFPPEFLENTHTLSTLPTLRILDRFPRSLHQPHAQPPLCTLSHTQYYKSLPRHVISAYATRLPSYNLFNKLIRDKALVT